MKTKQLQVSLSGLVVGLGLVLSPALASAATGDIVDKAVNTPALSTLVTVVTQAGLASTLQGAGPFTVFAPTNDAFANIPGFIKKALDRDPALLKQVLLYHVVSGDVKASQVVNLSSAKTVQGSKVKVQVVDGKVKIDNAEVVIADVGATNGTVHVINQVIVPRSIIVAAALSEIQEILAKINNIRDEGLKLDSSM
jgi:uncharacterized surface protein with fasciclin (FAS1) repeats